MDAAGARVTEQAKANEQLAKVTADRWSKLAERGAQTQRLLWASTGTKNPAYSDLLYVDSLVADETVNTMPDATLADTLDHANFSSSLLLNDETCQKTAALLNRLAPDVNLGTVTAQLESEGVAAFAKSFDELLATLTAKISVK